MFNMKLMNNTEHLVVIAVVCALIFVVATGILISILYNKYIK